ncbi:uncharacterized protein RCO7_08097 [Rhynchosporium graminicola]|uniref:Uncharacterized protein n=1 Tax=Rhynchosporium graminicola TaxID=2792576 RepID=A0A1E1K7U2_9HELO|nr:uncharacterized protein RCO7_08097 [Rhynchosporium commune]
MMPRTIEEGFADQALLTYARYCEAVEKSQRWKDIENLIDFSVCLNLSTEGLQGNFGYSTYIPYSTVPVKSRGFSHLENTLEKIVSEPYNTKLAERDDSSYYFSYIDSQKETLSEEVFIVVVWRFLPIGGNTYC